MCRVGGGRVSEYNYEIGASGNQKQNPGNPLGGPKPGGASERMLPHPHAQIQEQNLTNPLEGAQTHWEESG